MLPLETDHQAVLELAKLTLWLEDVVIDKKTEGCTITEIDPESERCALASIEIEDRVENTARICADAVWKPMIDEWRLRHPFVTADAGRQMRNSFRGGQAPGVRRNHYSPAFSNKHWALGTHRRVRIYSLGVDQRVQFADKGYRTWAREDFFYSQSLERTFSLIENDAEPSYAKLLATMPLGKSDRRNWIVFLAAQLLRTPSFVLANLSALRNIIIAQGMNYPTDIEHLRKAYETLFSNERVFTAVHKLICDRRWQMWGAPSDQSFIRPDNPIVIAGSLARGDWQLIYPLTPQRCFVVGPEAMPDPPDVVPRFRQLSRLDWTNVTTSLASAARRTILGSISNDDAELVSVLDASFGSRTLGFGSEHHTLEYWGALSK